ncbi:tripartite tricarboxylate transporter TctB family protein [Puniceibacterium sp. IMCC21224]|uniref:tripartite tricarboxylate transporter TctB family protein n=1 Tax=Puniceibacterium sp. IMCC21224 TaxID=1618204 RepID=UPI00064DAFD3|nr:tripartite tricarboxylate transporter TctB family protein [Puniceibacterium sp. IMCC21224]KMK67646.1 Tripartite tricarboxylate transporter TctB family [Puniceibacterium sp. IMCC21224]
MGRVDTCDIIAGILICATGLFFTVYSVMNYDLGTIKRMGTGMFPFGVGLVLAVLGLLIMAPAFYRRGTLPEVDARSLIMVLLSIAAFALLVVPTGLVPAIFATTILSSFAERKVSLKSLAGLCLFLSTLAYMVFRIGLDLPLSMFKWPF